VPSGQQVGGGRAAEVLLGEAPDGQQELAREAHEVARVDGGGEAGATDERRERGEERLCPVRHTWCPRRVTPRETAHCIYSTATS